MRWSSRRFGIVRKSLRGNNKCAAYGRDHIKTAGFRARAAGDFCFGKSHQNHSPEARAAETVATLRTSLAAESGREAFPRLAARAPPSLAAPLRADLARSSARLALRVRRSNAS